MPMPTVRQHPRLTWPVSSEIAFLLLLLHGAGLVVVDHAQAADRDRLEALRRSMRERMKRSPLMDEAGFTRAMEACYVKMWEETILSGRALPSDGVPSANLIDRARALRSAGDLAECEAACFEILRQQPDHLEALTLLWDICFEANRPGLAIDWLLKAIAVNAGVAAIHHMLGCSLQAIGKVPDALAAFQQALQLDPAMAKAHNNVGCLLEAAGMLPAAAQYYRHAVDADPTLAQALYNLGNAFKQLGNPLVNLGCLVHHERHFQRQVINGARPALHGPSLRCDGVDDQLNQFFRSLLGGR